MVVHAARLAAAAPATLALAALAVLATALAHHHAAAFGWLVADTSDLAQGQWWRLVTGPLVHATAAHLRWDVACLLVIGLYLEPRSRALFPALVALGLVVPALAAVLAHPDMARYFGLSGLTYTLLCAALCHELARDPGRFTVHAAMAFLAFKIGRDFITESGMFVTTELGADVHKVPEAHLAGALVGALAVLAPRVFAPRVFARLTPRLFAAVRISYPASGRSAERAVYSAAPWPR